MSYILQGNNEARRLDEQTTMDQFSLDHELKDIQLKNGSKVLDAGCGSGVLCRFIESKYPQTLISGCDLSIPSLEYAKKNQKLLQTTFFQQDFVNNPFDEKYDFIFNRLVAHHLNEEKLVKAFSHFYQALSHGGKVCIIDPDGLFLNLGTQNKELLKRMQMVKAAFDGDLNVARIIPSILKSVGFSNITWRTEVMDFQGEGRKLEAQQWKGRFENSLEFYIKLFGSEFSSRQFFKMYIDEVLSESVPLFYNKFIIHAEKN